MSETIIMLTSQICSHHINIIMDRKFEKKEKKNLKFSVAPSGSKFTQSLMKFERNVVVKKYKFISRQTQCLNMTCFGCSIRPSSDGKHKYIIGKVCYVGGLSSTFSLIKYIN
jgi:hypothetical protein